MQTTYIQPFIRFLVEVAVHIINSD